MAYTDTSVGMNTKYGTEISQGKRTHETEGTASKYSIVDLYYYDLHHKNNSKD